MKLSTIWFSQCLHRGMIHVTVASMSVLLMFLFCYVLGGGDSQRISSFIWNHFLLAGGVDLAFTLLAAPTSCLFVAQLEQVDKYSRVHHQVR